MMMSSTVRERLLESYIIYIYIYIYIWALSSKNHPSALIFGNAFFCMKVKFVASEIIFENFTSISQTIVDRHEIYELELKYYKMAIFEKSHFKVNVIWALSSKNHPSAVN